MAGLAPLRGSERSPATTIRRQSTTELRAAGKLVEAFRDRRFDTGFEDNLGLLTMVRHLDLEALKKAANTVSRQAFKASMAALRERLVGSSPASNQDLCVQVQEVCGPFLRSGSCFLDEQGRLALVFSEHSAVDEDYILPVLTFCKIWNLELVFFCEGDQGGQALLEIAGRFFSSLNIRELELDFRDSASLSVLEALPSQSLRGGRLTLGHCQEPCQLMKAIEEVSRIGASDLVLLQLPNSCTRGPALEGDAWRRLAPQLKTLRVACEEPGEEVEQDSEIASAEFLLPLLEDAQGLQEISLGRVSLTDEASFGRFLKSLSRHQVALRSLTVEGHAGQLVQLCDHLKGFSELKKLELKCLGGSARSFYSNLLNLVKSGSQALECLHIWTLEEGLEGSQIEELQAFVPSVPLSHGD